MKSHLKYLFIALGAAVVIVGLLLGGLFLAFDSMDMCGAAIYSRNPSPDKTRDAVVFEVDCGATSRSRSAYKIAITSPGEERPDKSGTLFFSATTDLGSPPGEPTVTWVSSEKIIVLYASALYLNSEPKTALGNISVSYVSYP
jgi:hypothetical protein